MNIRRESGRRLVSIGIRESAGAMARLRTELMTAVLAMQGLLPMAISTDIGSEVQRALAVVLIGGAIWLANRSALSG